MLTHASRWQSALSELLEESTVSHSSPKSTWHIVGILKTSKQWLSNDNKAFFLHFFFFPSRGQQYLLNRVSCLSTHLICLKHHNSELTKVTLIPEVIEVIVESTLLSHLQPSGKKSPEGSVPLFISTCLNNTNRSAMTKTRENGISGRRLLVDPTS